MKDIPYKLLRPIIRVIYKIIYHPIINGIENIPDDGAVIFCGNHTHVMDQFNVLIVTKRVVHYLAKEEYFESKYAWFFKMVGCIKVDRRIHDDEAKSNALEVLKSGGSIGLFPEGTRNEVTCKKEKLDELYEIVKDKYTKDELIKLIKPKNIKFTQVELLIKLKNNNVINDNELKEYILDPDNSLKKLVKKKKITISEYDESLLLPLKYGAVSFASKTGAKIIPFGINGKYSKKSGKLICNIGKPLDIKGMSLEDANKLLSKNIIKLMKKSG